MRIRFIKSSEKRRILEALNNQFGIEKMPYLLIEAGKDRIRGFSGHLSKEEISELGHILNIELIGLYMIKQENDFRISIDACHLLKNQIIKGIIELNDSEFQQWIRGKDVEKQSDPGTFVIKYKDDFIGCTKANGRVLFNYVPKDRRLKKN